MSGIDTTAEARAWAAARNVPDDVMTEDEFLRGGQDLTQYTDALRGYVDEFAKTTAIPGYREHTEAAIARIAHNSIVALDAREQAMGDLEEALAHLFDDDTCVDLSMRLTAARRAWQSWKATT